MKGKKNMIPKIIHYCWFGGNPLPDLAKKCIDSWKKFCPDYEIIEWNELNYDVTKCAYLKEAYHAKKWAFVSDYARFDILYNYGGLYFDTDVELIESIEDIVSEGPFMGCEPTNLQKEKYGVGSIASGLGIGSPAHLSFYKEILTSYETDHFILKDGSYNLKTVVHRVSEIIGDFDYSKNEIQVVKGIRIYPADYFCPLDYYTGELNITSNTRSIHHYTASWHDKKEKYYYEIEKKFRKKYGEKLGYRIYRFYSLPFRISRKLKKY